MSSPSPAGLPSPDTTVESLGKRLRRAAPSLRVLMCSVHDPQGEVLWLSEGFLGPDEHCAVLRAAETFPDPRAADIVIEDIEDGRSAVVLRAATIAKRFVAAVMFMVDARANTQAAILAQLKSPAVTELLKELAWLRAPVTPGIVTTQGSVAPADIGATAIGRVIDLPIAAAQVPPEVDRLCAALRRTEIALHVQRLVPLRPHDGVRRFEVLLRSGGDLRAAPTKMLARATKAGLASMIDRRVFTMLLGWLVKNRTAWASEPGQFSMNLSATALRDKHFADFLKVCILKAPIPRQSFAFEVSAADCLANPHGVRQLGAVLGELGCPLAVDDFTAAKDSLVLITEPAIKVFKLSDRLSALVGDDPLAQARLRKLAQVLRQYGKTTVAKHVNDAAQVQRLRDYGIDYVQSYSASSPCALESLIVGRATRR